MENILLGTIVRLLDDRYTNYLVDGITTDHVEGNLIYSLKSQVYHKPDVTALRGDFDVYLTLKGTLNMQAQGLKEWQSKLNAVIYKDLETVILKSNEGKINPYDICRGQTLSTFVSNWKPNKPLSEIYL